MRSEMRNEQFQVNSQFPGFQATTIQMKVGQLAKVSASGMADYACLGLAKYGPEGHQGEMAPTGAPGPGLTKFSLIARAGGRPTPIGASGNVTATQDCYLEFALNDDYCADNNGAIQVQISVIDTANYLSQAEMVLKDSANSDGWRLAVNSGIYIPSEHRQEFNLLYQSGFFNPAGKNQSKDGNPLICGACAIATYALITTCSGLLSVISSSLTAENPVIIAFTASINQAFGSRVSVDEIVNLLRSISTTNAISTPLLTQKVCQLIKCCD